MCCRTLDKKLESRGTVSGTSAGFERRHGQRWGLHQHSEKYQVRVRKLAYLICETCGEKWKLAQRKCNTVFREQAWDEEGAKIDNVAQRLNYQVSIFLIILPNLFWQDTYLLFCIYMPRLKVTTYISYIQKKKIYCKKHYICPKIITQNICKHTKYMHFWKWNSRWRLVFSFSSPRCSPSTTGLASVTGWTFFCFWSNSFFLRNSVTGWTFLSHILSFCAFVSPPRPSARQI